MDSGDARFSSWQGAGRFGAEAGDDYPVVLHGFGVVKGRLVEGGMLSAFDADDLGDAVGGCEHQLISG